jgi:hypothetical protein
VAAACLLLCVFVSVLICLVSDSQFVIESTRINMDGLVDLFRLAPREETRDFRPYSFFVFYVSSDCMVG